jgi:uncharacterized protein (UPF0303 family)
MGNNEDLTAQIAQIEAQYRVLQFSDFTPETALTVCMKIVERARREKRVITVDAARNGHQLFHFSFDGTSPDNDEWVRRKSNTVHRFGKSSLHVGLLLKQRGMGLEERYFVSGADYSISGGAFPVIVRNVGVVGTVACSGLSQEEDHRWVVEAMGEYLGVTAP